MAPVLSRRDCLACAVVSLLAVPQAHATPEALAAAVREFSAGATPRDGRVNLDIAPLVENGNTVPVTITVDSPMTADDHVRSIALFNERNPLHDVAVFTLGPRAGKASVSTRIRLATSQRLVALARMADGSVWRHEVAVVVTLAACVES
jgi:sulfur-oxidizing protein SoxY